MKKQEEIVFFSKYGLCPYTAECNDSNDCNGTKEEMEICRQVKIVIDDREQVQFT
jgi:hypothetical protein